jgi:hypothetical protein
MSIRKVHVIEEVDLSNGDVGERQTPINITVNEDGSWSWNMPEDRLTPEQEAEWNRVLTALSNVNGEDFRHIVCGAGLMDHCVDPSFINNYAN